MSDGGRARRDKYQREIREYWVEQGTSGTLERSMAQTFTATLQHEDAPPDLLMDEPADNPIPFGFGNNPHEESIQSDEGENSTDSGGSDVSSPPKKRKGTSKAHQTAKKVQVEEPLEAGAKKGKLQANIPYINILAEQQCRMSRTWRLCWHRS